MKKTMAKLTKELFEEGERVPAGWKTCEQWAKEFNFSRPHMGDVLRKLIERRKVVMKKFKIRVGARMLPTQHYKEA